MSITDQDLKILKAERLTDYDDGGGQVTGQEVVDGVVNNLFGDISELDRVYGRVSLRKAYPAILTDNSDMAYGVHAAITDPPADRNVSVTMFSRKSWTDERLAAKDRVESYVISGPESLFCFYGDHLEGQRMVRWYCESTVSSPEVGEVYRLSIEKTGYTAREQYIRIQKVTSRTTQTFAEMVNSSIVEFKKDVLILETSAALRYDFPGGTPTKVSASSSPTKIRTTQVADAARYYGVVPLAVEGSIGDMGVVIDSPYAHLVPSTQSETPIVDATGGMGKTSYIPSGAAGTLTFSGSLSGTSSPDFPAARYLGMGCAKGSVSVSIGSTTLTDQGNGTLAPGSGDSSGFCGSVDYGSGLVTINKASSWSSTVSIAARPAAEVTDAAFTEEIQIKLTNRAYNYVPNLLPIPAPGTLTVDYRALGKWIRLTDNGKGQLFGRTGEGTGTIDYSTGSAIVTLGALPDVDSSILFAWSTPLQYEDRHGDGSIAAGRLEFTVANPAIKADSVSVSWLQGGVTKTATDNSSGILSGDGSGSVNYAEGHVRITPATAPDTNSSVTVTYTSNAVARATTAATAPTGRAYTFIVCPDTVPLKPGTVRITFNATGGNGAGGITRKIVITDDGAGGLVGDSIEAGGTLDYTTGEASFELKANVPGRQYTVTGWTPRA